MSPANRLFGLLMPRAAARTHDARQAIAKLKQQAAERRAEQDRIAEVASAGSPHDLRTSLQALSRKLAA